MKKNTVLAFDVYGTLIDTQGVLAALAQVMGDAAPAFSKQWREKQLEYSFRRGLMRDYVDFSVCTRNALDYACLALKQPLEESTRQELMAVYKTLPAFPDALAGLKAAKEAGITCYAFSNGSASAVEGLLQHAGILDYFTGVISVESLQTFKPNPDVYQYLLNTAETKADNAWLISSNPFDVLGALNHGMKTAWVKRSDEAIFDPWGEEPTVVISNLTELVSSVDSHLI
ncbi:haloacid dehalogenase type II [Oceanospirillum maris]|jgi:2-haloacid dehalogenase|uniref:haloacid dehalogenase type II n=1 Tax=Oceanospirillum maris TaxID=64977 RepID=UPI000418624E|nr:haloacid dehalogenase type II [Oceanospirillum maris]